MTKYAFCETVTAGANTPWHIRPLTDKGLMLGGGADTPSLCGRQVSWDMRTPVSPLIGLCCTVCKSIYRELVLKEQKIPTGSLVELKSGVRLFIISGDVGSGTQVYGLHWENDIGLAPIAHCGRKYITAVISEQKEEQICTETTSSKQPD